jgi:predicted amidohydrolase
VPAGILKIATCQFIVGSAIERNADDILTFIDRGASAGADIIHFSECALSGYAGANHENLDSLDWNLLKEKTLEIMARAATHKIWVILGSTHRLTSPNKPYNCLYLINPRGQIETRYDKRFCTLGDLDHYSPGSRFVTFKINGVTCSMLICFDLRFPELYRRLKTLGTQCLFQSFYNANTGLNIHTHIMRQTMQCHAATNAFWVSLANTAGPRSPYPSCFVQPDGIILKELKLDEPGMMVNAVDASKSFYDPSSPFRNAAINGALSNGPPLDDPRSTDILSL